MSTFHIPSRIKIDITDKRAQQILYKYLQIRKSLRISLHNIYSIDIFLL